MRGAPLDGPCSLASRRVQRFTHSPVCDGLGPQLAARPHPDPGTRPCSAPVGQYQLSRSGGPRGVVQAFPAVCGSEEHTTVAAGLRYICHRPPGSSRWSLRRNILTASISAFRHRLHLSHLRLSMYPEWSPWSPCPRKQAVTEPGAAHFCQDGRFVAGPCPPTSTSMVSYLHPGAITRATAATTTFRVTARVGVSSAPGSR